MNNIFSGVIESVFSNSGIFDRFRNWVHDGYRAENQVILEALNPKKKTLDFGCGIGQFSVLFDQKNYHGVDTDKKYIDFCKKSHKGSFAIINFTPPYTFREKYFDQGLMSAVVHHIDGESLRAISKELGRILKNNGKLLIVDHFTKNRQKSLFCRFLISLDRGNHFRDPEELYPLFSKEFKKARIKEFRNGPYRDYAMLLEKR